MPYNQRLSGEFNLTDATLLRSGVCAGDTSFRYDSILPEMCTVGGGGMSCGLRLTLIELCDRYGRKRHK